MSGRLELWPVSSRGKIPGGLTVKEVDVLYWVCQGLTCKQIGTILYAAPITVETHCSSIRRKTSSRNIAMMVRWAIRHGLINP